MDRVGTGAAGRVEQRGDVQVGLRGCRLADAHGLAGRGEEIARVVLTASGGPFCHLSNDQLTQVTVDDALAHPNRDMGPKITVE